MRGNSIGTGIRLWLALALLIGVALVAPHAASAQSCSLCYTQAAASTQRFIQALRSGILILMLPPMCLSIAIALIAYRRRNRFYQH
jgi:hypothetical protein